MSIEKGHGLTRDLSHSRPADELIAGWARGKVTSPLSPAILMDSNQMSGATADTRKIRTNGPKCQELG